MTETLTALYDDYGDAEAAVRDLEALGVSHADISILASSAASHGRVVETHEGSEAGAGAGAGAALGAIVGGGAGLLAGLGMIAIPGLGPVIAAGWLAAAATGAAGGAIVGGTGGGIIGAMIGNGVSEADAHVYAEGVRRGGTLVTVRVDEAHVVAARTILSQHGPVSAADRGRDYRAGGWTRFNENLPPYV